MVIRLITKTKGKVSNTTVISKTSLSRSTVTEGSKAPMLFSLIRWIFTRPVTDSNTSLALYTGTPCKAHWVKNRCSAALISKKSATMPSYRISPKSSVPKGLGSIGPLNVKISSAKPPGSTASLVRLYLLVGKCSKTNQQTAKKALVSKISQETCILKSKQIKIPNANTVKTWVRVNQVERPPGKENTMRRKPK